MSFWEISGDWPRSQGAQAGGQGYREIHPWLRMMNPGSPAVTQQLLPTARVAPLVGSGLDWESIRLRIFKQLGRFQSLDGFATFFVMQLQLTTLVFLECRLLCNVFFLAFHLKHLFGGDCMKKKQIRRKSYEEVQIRTYSNEHFAERVPSLK